MNIRYSPILILSNLGMIIITDHQALAYVGPGAEITMIGSLLAVLFAVLLAIFGIIFWPLRALLRKRRIANQQSAAAEVNEASNASWLIINFRRWIP